VINPAQPIEGKGKTWEENSGAILRRRFYKIWVAAKP